MPKTLDARVRRAVERAAIRNRDIGPQALRSNLRREIDNGRFPRPLPAIRTIHDWMKAARAKPDASTVDEIVWPTSFGDDALEPLPWAASGAYFELSRELDGLRPLLPVMLWFWRLSQTIPDASARDKRWLSVDLAFWERMPHGARPIDRNTLEAYILRAPWRRDSAARYKPAIPETAEQFALFSQQEQAEITELKFGALSIDTADLGPTHIWLHELLERRDER